MLILLQAGADMDAHRGQPAQFAFDNGHRHVVVKLLEMGCKGSSGTLCDVVRKGDTEVVEMMLKNGVHPSAFEFEALRTAVVWKRCDSIELLRNAMDDKDRKRADEIVAKSEELYDSQHSQKKSEPRWSS